MIACRLFIAGLCATAFATVLRAQAAVEYAAKSAGSAISGDGSEMHLGTCAVDSTLVACVKHSYPTAFYAAIVGACFFLWVLLSPKRRV